MKIAVLSRSRKIHSTKRLLQEIAARGHEPFCVDYTRCYCVVEGGRPAIYAGDEQLQVDAVIPRIAASVTVYGAALLQQLETMDVYSTVSSIALTRSRDKLRTLQLLAKHKDIGIPKTAFARHIDNVEHLIRLVDGPPVIIKLLEGTQGLGVVLAETRSAAKSVIQAFYGLHANIIVQEYVKEAGGQDIRALVVGNEVVAAMQRTAQAGEFRANTHRGGAVEAIELTDEEKQMALAAAKVLNLKIAGVDMMRSEKGPVIIEINSSPGLEGIERASGVNIANKMIEYIEEMVD